MTVLNLHGISHACFGLSYALALLFEIVGTRLGSRGLRIAGLVAGGAGLVAHTFYLATHARTPADPSASLLLLAWVLGVFYFYGTIHHARQAWAIFVLPVVLGLVVLSLVILNRKEQANTLPNWLTGDRFWGFIHGTLLLLAAVGVSIGFLASVMYLVQARRLRRKEDPLVGIHMLNLERLESMNRLAVTLAFPLLSAGLFLGAFLLQREHNPAEHWYSIKILGTTGLWIVFLLLVYLRYASHVPPRRLAFLTILSFGLMISVLAASHPFISGNGQPAVPAEVRP